MNEKHHKPPAVLVVLGVLLVGAIFVLFFSTSSTTNAGRSAIPSEGTSIDACEAYEGFLDGCAIKGGAYGTNPYYTACANEDSGERHATGEAVGFRCCSE